MNCENKSNFMSDLAKFYDFVSKILEILKSHVTDACIYRTALKKVKGNDIILIFRDQRAI